MKHVMIAVMMLAVSAVAMADVATFENVSLAPESFYDGSDLAGGFISGGFRFVTNYNTMYYSWDSVAASNTTDTVTNGWGNQYSAITGGGADGSSNYGVVYGGFVEPATIHLAPNTVDGMFMTNTTWAYLTMRDGGGFGAKKFGGLTGDDADWFKVTIFGQLAGASVGSVDFFLGDYRFADNSQDYLINDWTFVDLSGLGEVDTLTFGFSGSDNDPVYGLNTPGYVAIDNVVPEPATMSLLALGAVALIRRKK